MDKIVIKIEGGHLVATPSQDPNYPGIDVEFVADNDKGETASRPRVLFEKPLGEKLRALIWGDSNKEDYTDEIEFS